MNSLIILGTFIGGFVFCLLFMYPLFAGYRKLLRNEERMNDDLGIKLVELMQATGKVPTQEGVTRVRSTERVSPEDSEMLDFAYTGRE